MKKVEITTGNKYNVYIGDGLLDALDTLLPLKREQKVLIVTDDTVDDLYGQRTQASLEKLCTVYKFVFKHGEASKNIATLFEILEYSAKCGLDRSSAIIALGGGVVGDIAALAAALYMRGIAFYNIATTLLAMIDSSVGGKSAIDLPSGKNLAGVIRQPNGVICDVRVLDTLSEETYTCGMAEAVKYRILYGTELNCDREQLVYECVQAKNKCVSEDEFENGNRRLLNLGHTVGHAIEACSGYSVPHGIAVAAGIGVIAKASYSYGFCTLEAFKRVRHLLTEYGLSVSFDFTAEDLSKKIKSDKKAHGNHISFVVINDIGKCGIEKIHFNDIENFIGSGME